MQINNNTKNAVFVTATIQNSLKNKGELDQQGDAHFNNVFIKGTSLEETIQNQISSLTGPSDVKTVVENSEKIIGSGVLIFTQEILPGIAQHLYIGTSPSISFPHKVQIKKYGATLNGEWTNGYAHLIIRGGQLKGKNLHTIIIDHESKDTDWPIDKSLPATFRHFSEEVDLLFEKNEKIMVISQFDDLNPDYDTFLTVMLYYNLISN